MYVPQHFTLPEDYIRDLLRRPATGNLVTVHEGVPEASMVPFYLDEESNALVTHLVRNNPQARLPVTGPGLVVLDDVDAYVSPRWYATNKVKANVPTWDYITIHVRGPVRIDPDPAAALAVARRLTDLHEDPEVLQQVGDHALERMARAIVSVEVAADEVRGKAKMSQNRHPDDIRSLAAELASQGHEQMAAFLREVSLPYAEKRFTTLARLRQARGGQPVVGAQPDQESFH